MVIAEQKRSQGPAFDPSSRIPSGHLIGHNRTVTGTLTTSGTTAMVSPTLAAWIQITGPSGRARPATP